MSEHHPTRRRILATGAATAVAGLLPHDVLASPADGHGSRPNIMWFVSEDNNPYLGAYGDPLARTPTIDALAREGVLYRNAFSTAPVCAPSRFSIITGMNSETAGPAENMRAEARLPSFVRGLPQYLREAGYYCTNNSKTDYNSDLATAATWDESSDSAHWDNRPDGSPFFAVFNTMTTHESTFFKPAELKTDPDAVRVPAYLPDTPHIREDKARYYDLMERMDGELADRLAELDDAGLAEDTIVFYYGDNGGLLPWSKRYANDNGFRVPLVVRYPKKWSHLEPARPGSAIDSPVTLMDCGPTVLSLASVRVPRHVHGQVLAGPQRTRPARYAFGMRNRMGERYDMVRSVSDGRMRYVRNYAPHRVYGQVIAYEWQQKGYQDWEQAHIDGTLDEVQDRFWNEKPAEELYDTHADPDGIHNLIDDHRHAATLTRMRRALDEHMLEMNDNGFIPESSPIEGYDNSRAPGAYPLKQVMELAAKAIERQPRHARGFARGLGHENEVMCYWAAQGLLMTIDAAAREKETVE